MDIFKYSRGHFWGTIIPGAFLLINAIFLYPKFVQTIVGVEINFTSANFNFAYSASFIIIAYVLGIGLRLLNLDALDKISLITKIPKILYESMKNKDKNKNLITICKRYGSSYWQSFPYVQWFFTEYLNKSTKSCKEFYDNMLVDEYDNNWENIGEHFGNYCKTFIYSRSSNLSEEIMYNEGLSRFMSGVIYSIMFVLIIVGFNITKFFELFWIYILLLIVFLYRFRGIRVKEALAMFDGYMILNQENRACKSST